MKIVVLVSSLGVATQAGARIRYQRIAGIDGGGASHQLVILPFDKLAEVHRADGDIFIISKCRDVRAHLAAHHLAGTGRLVGIDLFDDYFSQRSDARLGRFRYWLESLLPMVDFVMVSTQRMAEVVRSYDAVMPLHVMNDPADPDADPDLAPVLDRKLERALRMRRIEICWFGMGDNPHFPVGLHDLVAFSPVLAGLRGAGFEPSLRILTNPGALASENLAMLGRLPVPFVVEEWSLAREAEALDRALVSFLPVNAQNFSVAKSLNRAISALARGTQVLTAGYPLYAALGDFLYRDPAELLADLARSELRLRTATLGAWRDLTETWASPEAEAQRLAGFLRGLRPARRAEKPHIGAVVLHGRKTLREVDLLARDLGYFSIAAPPCGERLPFDARFLVERGAARLFLSERAAALLDANQRARLAEKREIDGRFYRALAPGSRPPFWPQLASVETLTPAVFSAASEPVMQMCEDVLSAVLPGYRCFRSELSDIPSAAPPRMRVS